MTMASPALHDLYFGFLLRVVTLKDVYCSQVRAVSAACAAHAVSAGCDAPGIAETRALNHFNCDTMF
jgi:hypothetical protein